MKMEPSDPKRRHIKFRPRGIIQKKAYKFITINTFTAIVELSRFNNSCLKSRQRRP